MEFVFDIILQAKNGAWNNLSRNETLYIARLSPTRGNPYTIIAND